jgi:leader peptidase (prepilin peptidase)/N-methyltransferase
VELLSAVSSVLTALHFGVTAQAIAGLVLTWTLIALAGIDLRTQLLPDQLTLPLVWLGLILSVFGVTVSPQASIVGAVAGYLSLWSVYWLFKLATGKEGMGYGDFKLFSVFGAWMGAGALLPIILFASLTGAIGGSIYLLRGSKERLTPIPFGPFLAAGGWVWFVLPSAVKDSTLLQAFGLLP